MNLKSFKKMILFWSILGTSVLGASLLSASVSVAAKLKDRPPMEMLAPHTFNSLTSVQQKQYLNQLRKTWLEFERKLPQSKKVSSFWRDLFLNEAHAASSGTCLIGGSFLSKVNGRCPTKEKPCPSESGDGFSCGLIFAEACINRMPTSSISERCYAASANKPASESVYKEIVRHTNQDFSKVCVRNRARSSTDGCTFLAKKFSEIATQHRIQIAGVEEFKSIQEEIAASKISTPVSSPESFTTDTAALEASASASAPAPAPVEVSPLLKYGIGPGGKVLKPEEASAMLEAAGTVSDLVAKEAPRGPTPGLDVRACNPINSKNNNPVLLPKFDLAESCGFDNNRALLGSLDAKGCNKDRNMEYLFATRIQSVNKNYINNNAADIISGVVFSSELVERKSATQATFMLKMITHNVNVNTSGPPAPKVSTYKIEQNDSKYFLVDNFGLRKEISMTHVWRKTVLEVEVNGANEQGAHGAFQSITSLANDCDLASDIRNLKSTAGLNFSPRSIGSPSRGSI